MEEQVGCTLPLRLLRPPLHVRAPLAKFYSQVVIQVNETIVCPSLRPHHHQLLAEMSNSPSSSLKEERRSPELPTQSPTGDVKMEGVDPAVKDELIVTTPSCETPEESPPPKSESPASPKHSESPPPPVTGKRKPKPPPAGAQLIGDLPRAETEAKATFTEMPNNHYQYGTLGRSREAGESMLCDCQYEHGTFSPFPPSSGIFVGLFLIFGHISLFLSLQEYIVHIWRAGMGQIV